MRLRWGISALAAVLFAVLAVMSVAYLETEAGGPFDGRLAGYSWDAAKAYLAALKPAQQALYTGSFRLLDTIFPTVLAASLVLWARHLAPRPWRIVFYLLAALYLVADLVENALVAQMLAIGAENISPYPVAIAALFTKAKWAFLGLTFFGLAVSGARRT